MTNNQLTFDIPTEPITHPDVYGLVPTMIRMKYCCKCKRDLPRTDFPFVMRGRRRTRGTYCTACAFSNLRRFQEENPTEYKALKKRKYQEDPDPQIIRMVNQRAMKRGVPGLFSVAEWKALKVQFGNRCAYCGLAAKALWVDHIFPIALWGKGLPGSTLATNDISNILPACQFCNRAKADLPVLVFMAWLHRP